MSTLSSADFFLGLERVDGETEVSFRKNNRAVTSFPSKVFLNVRARPCTRNVNLREDLSSLRLQLFWKDGLVMQPARFQYSIGDAETWAEYNQDTFVRIAVESSGVSLRNSLILVINHPDGKQRLRISARL